MSHIERAKINTIYKDINLLKKALSAYGQVQENVPLYRVGYGFTEESYQVVLIDQHDNQKRIGFNKVGDSWLQYQESYGSYGTWTNRISTSVQDHYNALQYASKLEAQGLTCTIQQLKDGSVQLEALEQVW